MQIRTISRAIAILKSIHESSSGLTLLEIAKSVELSKATTYRFAQALLESEFLRFEPRTSRYSIGPELMRFGKLGQSYDDLRILAAPYLEALRDTTLETVSLVVPIGRLRMTLCVVLSEYELRAVPEVGARKPLYTGAAGKALLAWYNEEELEKYLTEEPLIPVTPQTISNVVTMRQDLVRVRARGYAISVEETVIGQAASAAPIIAHDGRIVAAVNLSGPVVRLPAAKLHENGEHVARTAAEISRALDPKPSFRRGR